MTERITIRLQRAAVTLADSLDYGSAVERLNISESELAGEIAELERSLNLKVFGTNGRQVEVTDAGALFIDACRAFLATQN
jgi:DNA-binding transcriptional LysR family regulator